MANAGRIAWQNIVFWFGLHRLSMFLNLGQLSLKYLYPRKTSSGILEWLLCFTVAVDEEDDLSGLACLACLPCLDCL